MDVVGKEESQNRGTGTDTPAIQALTSFDRTGITRRRWIAILGGLALGGCRFRTEREPQWLPDVKLEGWEGARCTTRDLDPPFLLVLFRPFCPACSLTLAALSRVQAQWGKLPVHLVVEEGRRAQMRLLPRSGFQIWFALERELIAAFGRLPRPVIYTIDPQGRIVKRQIGSRSDADLERHIRAHFLSAGPKADGGLPAGIHRPEPDRTRALVAGDPARPA